MECAGKALLFVLAVVLRIIAGLVAWALFLPVLIVVCTPYILVAAVVKRGPRHPSVSERYAAVYLWWQGAIDAFAVACG